MKLTRNEVEGIDMAPGYQDGLVYVSTVPVTAEAAYEGGGVGTLWALDAKTGQETVALRHRAEEPLGRPEGQLRRRPLVPARLRRQGLDVLRRRQPGAVPRHRQ